MNPYEKLNLIEKECSKPGWFGDYEPSDPISKKTIQTTKKILNNISSPIEPEIFPTPLGTIQIEFEYENTYLEFEIIDTCGMGCILSWFSVINNEEHSGTIDIKNYDKMNDMIYNTFGGLEWVERKDERFLGMSPLLFIFIFISIIIILLNIGW